jgi:hypothetical protein
MQRFRRSQLLCLWCCALFVVFSYVLFDLLDIDGSNIERSLGSCLAAEEPIGCEEGGRHITLALSPTWLLPRSDHGAMSPSSTLTSRIPHPFLLHRQPHATLQRRGRASTQPDSDPAWPLAEP